MTIHNLGSKTTTSQLHAAAVVSATASGSVANLDLQPYEGDMVFVLDHAAAGSGVTLTAAIQHSDTTTSGDFVNVTGGAFTAAAANTAGFSVITLNTDGLKRYVRVRFTVSGGSGTGAASVIAIGSQKSL